MSTLTIVSHTVGYDDEDALSNPTRKPIDYRLQILSIPVNNPSTQDLTVGPLSTKTVFDGTVATAIDNTTVFDLSPSLVDATLYRLTNSGGTAPAFRTDRALTLSGIALTLTLNPNLSLTVTASGSHFGSVVAGDVVFIPGIPTGDIATVFNSLNVGYWNVLVASAGSITLARPNNEVFSGISEVVTPASNTQFQAFSSAGVQSGDTVELSAGFAATAFRAYTITEVNPKWIEFASTTPLGSQASITPTTSGIAIYNAAKRYIQLHSDQETVIRVNGDTSNIQKISPWLAGGMLVGEYRKTGTVYKLVAVNLSSTSAKLVVISAE